MFKYLAEYKLKLGKEHELDEEELMKRYEEYIKGEEERNCQLDVILEGVDERVYDLKVV